MSGQEIGYQMRYHKPSGNYSLIFTNVTTEATATIQMDRKYFLGLADYIKDFINRIDLSYDGHK